MLGIEFVEPGIEPCHPFPAIQLGGDRPLGKRGDVQPGAPRLLVQVVREADVASGHTQNIHTRLEAVVTSIGRVVTDGRQSIGKAACRSPSERSWTVWADKVVSF